MSLDLTPQQFLEMSDEMASIAADYLRRLDGAAIQPSVDATALAHALGGAPPEQGRGRAVVDLLRDVVAGARAQNGRFLGYVLGSGEPVAATADLLASVLNQNLTAWRSSPAGVTLEQTVVRWLAEAIGCPGFTGSLTGGGSPANLMGLAMAREARAPANERGARGGVVYASTQVHMSTPKAVALLGIGRENLRLLPVDEALRLRVDLLEQAVSRDLAAGLVPVAVVASAGTVATGAIDPIGPIADAQRVEPADKDGAGWLAVLLGAARISEESPACSFHYRMQR